MTMSRLVISLLALLVSVTVSAVSGEKCQHPPAAPAYSNSLYSGRWYEVGKYQTLGGAIFQVDTVCTIATYQPYHMTEGGGDIGNSSSNSSSLLSSPQYRRLLQPETLPVRELDQRHGHSVSAGQPGTFLSDSQLWRLPGTCSGLQRGLARRGYSHRVGF